MKPVLFVSPCGVPGIGKSTLLFMTDQKITW